MVEDIADKNFYASQRHFMVDRQVIRRGIDSPVLLEALRKVPREAFVSEAMREFAYEDTPLPIAEDQTISQPFIVAYMLDALQLNGGEKVLEVGTGSGYAAAVLAEIASQVTSLERLPPLAEHAREKLASLGYHNVQVHQADGSLGWPQEGPYDAIVVAAGGSHVPEELKKQLALNGRLVMPVGASETRQTLLRVTRTGDRDFREDRLTDVRFVPLVGAAGWQDKAGQGDRPRAHRIPERSASAGPASTSELLTAAAEPIDDIETDDLDQMLERIGDARLVLIGEASHGTSEFYRYRARITRALIEHKGFNFVAVEADWPDASRVDHYVRNLQTPPGEWTAFSRFPTWMWRNEEVREFVDWLRRYNDGIEDSERHVGFYGLDMYSLFTSIEAVLDYLDEVDPETAAIARQRYGCLTPWQADPATYGRAALTGRYRECEDEVVNMLVELLGKRLEYSGQDGARYMDAVQNARLITNAERYYRSMYSGYSDAWNLRDQHMFDTLQALMFYGGDNARIVVWEHNSHVGDAAATDMVARGQHNVGQLCREAYGNDAYLIGFGTHTGTVAAATDWGDPMEIKEVQPSLEDSWERQFHNTGIPAFTLPLRHPVSETLSKHLHQVQLERAIGVIYRPETERASHYFRARLADQFDEYVWFDRTRAVTPLSTRTLEGVPDTYPFGL